MRVILYRAYLLPYSLPIPLPLSTEKDTVALRSDSSDGDTISTTSPPTQVDKGDGIVNDVSPYVIVPLLLLSFQRTFCAAQQL